MLLSGKRDSNSQPSAWKADDLPIDIFPLKIKSKKGDKSKQNNKYWNRTSEFKNQNLALNPLN